MSNRSRTQPGSNIFDVDELRRKFNEETTPSLLLKFEKMEKQRKKELERKEREYQKELEKERKQHKQEMDAIRKIQQKKSS